MSDEIRFDRRKGFVALPIEVLELDLSPGAFRLLVELCRMANLEGYCWPSLGQLGDRLGRSKAAVSGYVQCLRDAGLISTEEQRTANGYNYRLRYCVVFWKEWRASLSGRVTPAKTDQMGESRVRQSERIREKKNHISKNHEQSVRSDCKELIEAWSALVKGVPYPALRTTPSADLVSRTRGLVRSSETGTDEISADIAGKLAALWHRLSLDPDANAGRLVEVHLRAKSPDTAELELIVSTIEAKWQAHWRKIPSVKQLDQMLKSAGFTPRRVQVSLLESFLQRWEKAQKDLLARSSCERLPLNAMRAPDIATGTYIRGYS